LRLPEAAFSKRRWCAFQYAAALMIARRKSNCPAPSRAPLRTEERVQTNVARPVVLKLKTAWREGTAHHRPVRLSWDKLLKQVLAAA